MPWSSKDAGPKTSKANTPAKSKQWADTANSVVEKSGDEGKAIRIANAAVRDHPSQSSGPKKHWSGR